MKIKLFENFDAVDLDISYEIYEIDRNGDEEIFLSGLDDMEDINPFDLKDVIKYFMKYKDKHKLIIKKVTRETLDENNFMIAAIKYNI